MTFMDTGAMDPFNWMLPPEMPQPGASPDLATQAAMTGQPPPMLPQVDPGGLQGAQPSGRPPSPVDRLFPGLKPAVQGMMPGAAPAQAALPPVPGPTGGPTPSIGGYDETGLQRFDDTGAGAPGGPPPLGQSLQPQPAGTPGVGAGGMARGTTPSRSLGPIPGAGNLNMGGANPDMGRRIQEALKGVQVPKPPEALKPSTPALPRQAGQIKGGEIMALLGSLGLMGGGPAAVGGQKLPPTLGAALGLVR